MKKLLFTIFLTLLCCQGLKLYAQQDRMSPSPQALLNHTMSHSISEYSGLPDIRIPLYTIDLDGLEIPISLVYNGKGIQYKQFDGEIAAGWGLSVSGYQITRQIYGKPDEKNGSSDYDDMVDQFFYNIPASSGYFTMDRYLEIAKISPNRDYFSKITNLKHIPIIDENGFIYYFGSDSPTGIFSGETVDSSVSSLYAGCPTRWCMTSMFSQLTGKKVNFKYNSYRAYTDAVWFSSLTFTTNTESPRTEYSYKVEKGKAQYNTSNYISEISSARETVEFVRNNQGVLQNIYVKDMSGRLVKNIRLEYQNHTNHRLLASVTVNNEKYQFDYYLPDSYIINKTFPDTWGYYTYSSSFLPETLVPQDIFINEKFMEEKVTFTFSPTELSIGQVMPLLKKYACPRDKVDPTTLKYYSLSQITYPTGGTTIFQYEPNQDSSGSSAGGQRISRITTRAALGDIPIITKYEYGTTSVNGPTGHGYATTPFRGLDYFIQLLRPSVGIYSKKFSTSPIFHDTGLFAIYYDNIIRKEYSGDIRDENYLGRTVSKYILPESMKQVGVLYLDHPDLIMGKRGVMPTLSEYRLGVEPVLSERKTYDRGDRLQRSEIYHYKNVSSFTKSGKKAFTSPIPPVPSYTFINYTINSHLPILEKSEISDYDQSGTDAIINTINYTYDKIYRMAESSLIKSDGGTLKMKYNYPQSNSYLWTRNMLMTILRTERIVDGTAAGITEMTYSESYRRPYSIRYSPGGSSELRVIRTFTYDMWTYGKVKTFVEYEEGPAGIVQIPHVIYYSYNNEYPIVTVRGLTSTQLQDYNIGSLLPASTAVNPSESQIISGAQQLNALLGTKGYVTATTYQPLVGIKTYVDETGRKVVYNYNEFGKLRSITDDKGNIVKEYEYNVKNK